MILLYLLKPAKIAAELKALDTKTQTYFDSLKGPKQACCPECGGTDCFNGYGVCMGCEIM